MPKSKTPEDKKAPINQITRKSRAIYPLLNGDQVPLPDMTVSRSRRHMGGLDVEEWRGLAGLSRFDGEAALGFRSSTLYNRECKRRVLPVRTEILIRLYDLKPENFPWKRLSFKDLFESMYQPYIDQFEGEVAAQARNDLEARFTVLFGRSPTRGYAWLRGDVEDEDQGSSKASSYATIERILQKLTQWGDEAGEVFERVAIQTLRLRGIDIDEIFPIPTPDRPPERLRPGRRPRSPEELAALAKQKEERAAVREAARKKAAAEKAAAKQRAAERKEAAQRKAAEKRAAIEKRAAERRAAAEARKKQKAAKKRAGAKKGARKSAKKAASGPTRKRATKASTPAAAGAKPRATAAKRPRGKAGPKSG